MNNVKTSREDNFKMHLREIVIIKMYTLVQNRFKGPWA
jgi:hypothetical protein